MTKKISILFCVLLVVSCQQESAPKGVLTRQEMSAWLLEVYMAEARAGSWPITRDSSYKLFLPFQDSLKSRRGLKDSTIIRSYEYYLGRPNELESIYDIVIDSLNLREQRLMRAPSVPPQQ